MYQNRGLTSPENTSTKNTSAAYNRIINSPNNREASNIDSNFLTEHTENIRVKVKPFHINL